MKSQKVAVIHSSYNLNVTHVNTQRPHKILWYTCNFTYYELPLCIGLQACPPPEFNFTRTHTCAGCNKHVTTSTSILLPRSHQSQAKVHAHLLTDVLIVSAGVNFQHPVLITGAFIRCWCINWSGYARLVSNVKTLKNSISITVKVNI